MTTREYTVKLRRIDETIAYYENQLEATGEKLAELKRERSRLQEAMLADAITNGGVHREELSREPDGDLLWA